MRSFFMGAKLGMAAVWEGRSGVRFSADVTDLMVFEARVGHIR